MPSPFPGMDPYLEDPAFWPDFHHSFIAYWCDALNDQLPDQYEARINVRARLVELPEEPPKEVTPDVEIATTDSVVEPVAVPLILVAETEDSYIQLLHRPERSLVAVLELLSPSNKTNPDRADYLLKRNALLRQQHVHLIELDLLLGGQRLPMGGPLPQGDFYALVSRAGERTHSEVYAWTLQQRLSAIRQPLKEPDPDLVFDLGAVLVTAYERGRYARALRYAAPPPVALNEANRGWAEAAVRAWSKR